MIRMASAVVVAVAPQLFPTPRDLAARMVEEANIQPWDLALEPSAGTGPFRKHGQILPFPLYDRLLVSRDHP